MRLLSVSLFLAMLGLSSLPALSAPTQSRSFLPIGKELVMKLKNDHDMSEQEVQKFIIELNKLSFFADHANPEEIDKLDDISVHKTYYMAPYFQPSGEREVVADLVVAISALKATRAIDDLVGDFSFKLNQLRKLRRKVDGLLIEETNYIKAIKFEEAKDQPDTNRIKHLKNEIAKVAKAIKTANDKIEAIYKGGASEYDSISESLRQEIVGNFLYGMSRLGVEASDEEMTKLRSKNSITVLGAMAKLRLRAAKGQFGLRNVIVESGLTESQMGVLSLYRQLRPDVTIKTLPVSKVFVRSTGQTSNFGKSSEQGFMQIRDINRSSQDDKQRGLCGSISACNVTIEYTEQGATITNANRVNAVFLPVVFVGDAKVSIPDFEGRFDCKFRNGWWSKGRADVKDGWVIYDGDVYNKIKYEGLDKMEDCKVEITKGDRSSAAATILMELSKYYQDMFNARTIRSESDMKKYRESVDKDIKRHAQQSQKNKGNWVQYSIGWARGTMSGWGAVVGTFVTMARNFYWHTRIEDTKIESVVEIHKKFKFENMVDTLEFAFDGFPALCHKKSDVSLGTVAVACSGGTANRWNNEIENHDNICGHLDADRCERRIDDMAIENEDGFLVL